MASDLTTASFIFKRKYADKRPSELAKRFHPSLQMMRKKDGFNGHDTVGTYFYAVRYANPQGVSGVFASAQGIASGSSPGGASSGKQFAAARRTQYGIINLKGPALRAARGKDGAFIELVTLESEGVFTEVGDELGFQLHRAGNGDKGRRASISTNTITLETADDARNFKVDMVIIASANQDGSSPRTGETFVTAVDEDAGTITVNDATDITSFADNDYLFRKGNTGALGTIVDGYESHLPLAAPVLGVDSFRNVDRGSDARRLAGVRTDDPATSIEENAGLTAVKINQVGKRASHVLLNPIRFWEVCRRLNAKVEYAGGGGGAGYGFETFRIHTQGGSLTAVSDPDAPVNRGRVVNIADWEWKHLGNPWIHPILDDKGGMFLRVYNDDAIEGRIVTEGNTICWAPAANGTFSIA